MPTITLLQTACNQGLDTTRVEVTTSNSLIFENAVAPELVGSGVKITQIVIRGYARNSNTVYKYLQMGFKPAINSGRTTWSTYNGTNVVGDKFTAVKNSTSGSYIYNTITKTYNETTNADTFALFAGHIKESFDAGNPVYLGIIQPSADYSTQTYVNGYWQIEVTYELLGNVPTTDKTSVVLGETVTTSIETVLEGSTTVLKYKMGDNVLSTIGSLATGATHTYTVPTSAGAYFPNTKTGVLTIEAETFLNGTSYGVVSTEVTVGLPSESEPTCTITTAPYWPSTIASGAQISAFVQSKSGAEFTMTGTGKYGASIAGYKLTIEGMTYEANPATHVTINGSGDVAYSYTVTDSRGLSRTYNGTLSVLTWRNPQIQTFTITRVTADGTEAIDGTYGMATLNANVNSLNVAGAEKNTLTYRIEYRVGVEEGEPENSWIACDSYNASSIGIDTSFMLTSGGSNVTYDDMTGYEFRAVVTDLYGISYATDKMATKVQHLDIDEESGNIGFGGDAPTADEAAGYRFHKPVEFAQSAFGINLADIGIQAGYQEQVTGLSSSSYVDREITFPVAYAEGTTPHVVAGFFTASTAGSFGRCCVSVHTVTNVGFTMRFFNGDSSARSPQATWIAIGTPAIPTYSGGGTNGVVISNTSAAYVDGERLVL